VVGWIKELLGEKFFRKHFRNYIKKEAVSKVEIAFFYKSIFISHRKISGYLFHPLQ
jgi:hypothetical protein